MIKRLFITACSFLAAGGLLSTSGLAAEGFAMTLEGDILSGAIDSIDAEGMVKVGDQTAELEALLSAEDYQQQCDDE